MRIAARSTPLFFAAALAGWMTSCNSVSPQPYTTNDGGTACDPGDTQACECEPAKVAGVASCQNDGTWGSCDCTNTDPCGDGVLLLVDRSGSMGEETKWTDFTAVLEDTLAAYDAEVPMGLLVFPDETCDGTDPLNLEKLCRAPTSISLDVAGESLSAIADKLEAIGTCGGTPTAGALERALDAVAASDLEIQVVLITDGIPNCNVDLDGFTCECAVADPPGYCQEHPEQCVDVDEAAAAAQILYDSGAPVHVIGYTLDAIWIDVMDDIAEAGGTENSEFCSSTDGLIIAIERILDSITDC